MVNWFEEIAAFPFAFKGPGVYAMARETTNRIATEYVACRSRHFRIFMRQVVGLLASRSSRTQHLLVLGGWLVISQQLTLGQFVASELIFGSIIVTLGKVGKKLEAWYDAMAAMDKLGHIIDLEVEREDGESPRRNEGGLELKGIDLGSLRGVRSPFSSISVSPSTPRPEPPSSGPTAPAPPRCSISSSACASPERHVAIDRPRPAELVPRVPSRDRVQLLRGTRSSGQHRREPAARTS